MRMESLIPVEDIRKWCGPEPMLLVVEPTDVRNLMELKMQMRMHSSLCATMDLGQ